MYTYTYDKIMKNSFAGHVPPHICLSKFWDWTDSTVFIFYKVTQWYNVYTYI